MPPSRRSQNADLESPLKNTPPRPKKPTVKAAAAAVAAQAKAPALPKPALKAPAKTIMPIKTPTRITGIAGKRTRFGDFNEAFSDEDPDDRHYSPSFRSEKERERKARHVLTKEATTVLDDQSNVMNAEARELKKNGKHKEAWQLYRESAALRKESNERYRDTQQRLQAQLNRKREEWDAEVAQFGKLEAKRRYDEVKALAAQANELSDSSIEQLEFDEEQADPEIDATLLVRVNKKVEIAKGLGKMRISKINFWSIEQTLNEELSKRDSIANGWEITQRLASIRPEGKRSTLALETFDEFSETEWERIYNAVLHAVYERGATNAVMKIEISCEAPTKTELKKKRAMEMLSSDPLEGELPPPKARHTRTDALLERERNRAEALANAGHFERELLQRWSCKDERCVNFRGYCFVDYGGKHYSMDHSQQQSWAIAISNGDVNTSVGNPPISLYRYWTEKQGAVNDAVKKPIQQIERQEARVERQEAKDMMTRFMEFSQRQLDMQIQQMMMDQMSSVAQRQAAYRPPPPPPPPPPQEYCQPLPQPLSSPQPLPQVQHAVPIVVQRKSSPIGHPGEEDHIIREFFRWKAARTSEARRQRVLEVYVIVDAQMWTIEDLKSMSDTSTTIYRTALGAGVPDGMARGFKDELKMFKIDWRVGGVLAGMANQNQ